MFQFDELGENRRRRINQFIDLCHRHVAQYTIISVEPLIFFMPMLLDLSHFVRDYGLLFDSLKERQVFFICSPSWYFERSQNISELKNLLDKYICDYPKFTFIIICNTKKLLNLYNEKNIKAVFCNNNCFIDENLFFPITPPAEEKYDAVYDARLVDWKRHPLAESIHSLAIIFYAIPWYEDNSYMKKIFRDFAHAHFFNHSDTGKCRKLSPLEINQALNRCRVGLCLSAEEGAMYASIQYLLAGLPVVTTPNVGGRDEFFDDEISITVEPTPEAVKAGVAEMIGRNLDPHYVRAKTLERMKVHRGYFISLIQSIYEQEGIGRDFSIEWKSIFFNKLLRNRNHLKTINDLNQIN